MKEEEENVDDDDLFPLLENLETIFCSQPLSCLSWTLISQNCSFSPHHCGSRVRSLLLLVDNQEKTLTGSGLWALWSPPAGELCMCVVMVV